MLTDQLLKPSETLHEYVQRFADLLLKSSRLLLHQAKDLAHITHFRQNLHNQKLKNYVLGKNTITLALKKDAELKIINGLHNHDSGYEINSIYPKHNNKPINIDRTLPCMQWPSSK